MFPADELVLKCPFPSTTTTFKLQGPRALLSRSKTRGWQAIMQTSDVAQKGFINGFSRNGSRSCPEYNFLLEIVQLQVEAKESQIIENHYLLPKSTFHMDFLGS